MSQNKDIPHADLIRAVLDGKEVEYLLDDNLGWRRFSESANAILYMANCPHWQYRLKPEPHKWQREMDAQAAGKMIQYRDDDQTWTDGASLKFTSKEPGAEYRIKPEPVTKERGAGISTERKGIAREPWILYLSDRADGVKGRYAIARWNPSGFREVWNMHSHRWSSASEEVLTLDEANALLKALVIPTKPAHQLARRWRMRCVF